MPTQIPQAWRNSIKKKHASELHPLAISCIVLLGILHVAGSFILQRSLGSTTVVPNHDVLSCAHQIQNSAPALPYD